MTTPKIDLTGNVRVVTGGKKPTFNNPENITYKPGQQEALNKLIDWSFAPGEHNLFCTLEGPAGTGKTTIIKGFLANSAFRNNVAVTATTHKATRVVGISTGVKSITIHKLLGLRPNVNLENYDINNVQFAPTGNKKIKNYGLIIIDECSMINRGLKELLEREARSHNVKILYVGDQYQLPPVNEDLSEVFLIANKVSLTELVRQGEGNPLIELLNVLRSDIKCGTNSFISFLHSSPIGKGGGSHATNGYYYLNDSLFEQAVIQGFSNEKFFNNIDNCRYTSYRNDTILTWNKFIRNTLFDNPEDILIKNDLLTSYSNLVDEHFNPVITNSDDYIINDINPKYINEFGIRGFLVQLKAIYGGGITKYLFIVNHADKENIMNFFSIFYSYLHAAENATKANKASAWNAYYTFKDRNLLLLTFRAKGTNKLIVSKDLDYGYGLTVHKTQGSTYNNIFVNLRDIVYTPKGFINPDLTLINRLAYVAISRAKEKAIIML